MYTFTCTCNQFLAPGFSLSRLSIIYHAQLLERCRSLQRAVGRYRNKLEFSKGGGGGGPDLLPPIPLPLDPRMMYKCNWPFLFFIFDIIELYVLNNT